MSAAPSPAPSGPTSPPTLGWTVAAAASLALFNGAALFSLRRVFEGGGTADWMTATIGLVAAIHVIHVLAERLPLPRAVAPTASVGMSVLAATRWFYPETAAFGFPTAATLRAFTAELGDAVEPLRHAVAPLPLHPALAAAITVGAGLLAAFTHTWVFGLGARGSAMAGPLGVFAFSSIAARGIDEWSTTALVLGAALVFWAVTSSFAVASSDGTAMVRPATARSTLALASIAAVLAAGGGAYAASTTSLERSEARFDLTAIGRTPAPRTVSSPLVRVGSLLRSNESGTLFTAQSADPHYWRLTALDRFDGNDWTSSATYDQLDSGELLASPFGVSTGEDTVTIRFGDFESDWIPAPYAAVSARTDIDLRVDETTTSLFVDEQTTQLSGRSVEVTSERPPDGTELGPVTGPRLDPEQRAAFTELTDETAATVRDTTQSVVGDATSRTEASRAIQDFLRSPIFRYDLNADYSRSDNPTADFLADGGGFCQQFASTFAAMARSIGIPARVAVGFTYGTAGNPPDSGWTISARNAHAWPEVFIDGLGWLPFEPTPGRGNPDAVGLTGVPAQQDGTEPDPIDTTTSTTSDVAPTTTIATPASGVPTTVAPTDGASEGGGQGSAALRWLALGVLGIVAGLGGGTALRLWVIARRKRDLADVDGDPRRAVAELYRRAVRDLNRVGMGPAPTETPQRLGETATEALGTGAIRDLARIESNRRYGPHSPDTDDVAAALSAGDDIAAVVRQRIGFFGRLRQRLEL